MKAICPGPENATSCDHRGCRYGGCQGRMPTRSRELLDDLIARVPEDHHGDLMRYVARERNRRMARFDDPRLRDRRDRLPGVEDIAAAVLGIATGK